MTKSFPNEELFKYYRFYVTDVRGRTTGSKYAVISDLQFFGRDGPYMIGDGICADRYESDILPCCLRAWRLTEKYENGEISNYEYPQSNNKGFYSGAVAGLPSFMQGEGICAGIRAELPCCLGAWKVYEKYEYGWSGHYEYPQCNYDGYYSGNWPAWLPSYMHGNGICARNQHLPCCRKAWHMHEARIERFNDAPQNGYSPPQCDHQGYFQLVQCYKVEAVAVLEETEQFCECVDKKGNRNRNSRPIENCKDDCDPYWKKEGLWRPYRRPQSPNGIDVSDGCEEFSSKGLCKKDGDHYGDNWGKNGTFDDWADAYGRTALVCPQCGCLRDYCQSGLPRNLLRKLDELEIGWNDKLRCENDIDGGRWILFQQNLVYYPDPFTTGTWDTYVNGFWHKPQPGRPAGPNLVFWMGLKHLADITATGKWQLLAKVRWQDDYEGMVGGSYGWAIWRDFQVEGQETGYRLKVGNMIKYSNIPSHPKKTYSWIPEDQRPPMSEDGQVYDPLYVHRNMQFSTPDEDNDKAGRVNCAADSGWWFNSCYKLDLNGRPSGRWHDGTSLHIASESIMALRMEA